MSPLAVLHKEVGGIQIASLQRIITKRTDIPPLLEELALVCGAAVCGPAMTLFHYGSVKDGILVEVAFPVDKVVETGAGAHAPAGSAQSLDDCPPAVRRRQTGQPPWSSTNTSKPMLAPSAVGRARFTWKRILIIRKIMSPKYRCWTTSGRNVYPRGLPGCWAKRPAGMSCRVLRQSRLILQRKPIINGFTQPCIALIP